MRTSTHIAVLFALFATAPVMAAAQMAQPAPAPNVAASVVADPTPAPQAGPRIENASVAFQPVAASDSTSAEAQRSGNSANLGQSRALMIAGGAAVIVGVIIGGDEGTLIAVGGAIVGLYGLYQYLK